MPALLSEIRGFPSSLPELPYRDKRVEGSGDHWIAGTAGCCPRSEFDLSNGCRSRILTTWVLMGDGGVEVNLFGAPIRNAIVVAFTTFGRGSRRASSCAGIFIAVSSRAVGWNLGRIKAEAGVIAA
jgi:hypothetical protein